MTEISLNICTHYITAIEYYDISGLSDQEIELVDEFLKEYSGYSFQYGEDSNFSRCDLCNEMADTVEVEAYKHD